MIKKFYFALLAITLGHSAAHSQITITQADYSMADYMGINGSDTSRTIGTGTAGASQTWDFSAYVPSKMDTGYLTGSSFTGNPLFPTAAFSSCATPSGFSVCSYGYINATGLFLLGFEQTATIGTTTMHSVVVMEPTNQVTAFPFTYSDTRTYSYVQHQVTSFTPAAPYDSTKAVYHRTVNQLCDGWGTLTTPYGTYNAIRIKETQSNIDTSYIHVAGTWTVSATSTMSYDTSYTWLASGIGTVATISGRAPSPYRYSFYKSHLPTGIAAIAQSSIAVYPNPATETLYVSNAIAGTKLDLSDATGRNICSTTATGNNSTIDMRTCTPGLYLLQITDASGNRTTHKISKQ